MRTERAVRRSGSPLQLAVCEGPVERARGLLGRPPPLPGHALWIVPCRAVHTWGMQYPIDVAFLDDRGLVLQVAPNCAPRRAYVDRRAYSAMEFRAGECARLHLRAGERLALPPDSRAAVSVTPTDEPRPAVLTLVAVLAFVAFAWLLAGCAADPARHGAGERAPAVSSASLEELRLQAGLEYDSRAWERAEAVYRELVHREPRDVVSWLRLGTSLLHLGRPDEAADVFATLIWRGERTDELLQVLAVTRVAQAAAALRAAGALRSDPLDAASGPWIAAAERLERLLPPSVPVAKGSPGVVVADAPGSGVAPLPIPAPRPANDRAPGAPRVRETR